MIGPLTYLDALVLAIASFSGLLALYRGFAREVLSILSWGVAAGAAFYFWKYHEPIARDVAQQIQAPPQVAQIGIALMIFAIFVLGRPFGGDFRVGPNAFELVLDTVEGDGIR